MNLRLCLRRGGVSACHIGRGLSTTWTGAAPTYFVNRDFLERWLLSHCKVIKASTPSAQVLKVFPRVLVTLCKGENAETSKPSGGCSLVQCHVAQNPSLTWLGRAGSPRPKWGARAGLPPPRSAAQPALPLSAAQACRWAPDPWGAATLPRSEPRCLWKTGSRGARRPRAERQPPRGGEGGESRRRGIAYRETEDVA